MKYRAQFVRTETYKYFVEIEADSIESAKEMAYEVFNDADIDSLEHYYVDGNDYLARIEQEST